MKIEPAPYIFLLLCLLSINLDTLAFKGYDDPKQITDFIEQYIDYDRLFEGALQKKINMFYEAMSWDLPVDKKNTLERFF